MLTAKSERLHFCNIIVSGAGQQAVAALGFIFSYFLLQIITMRERKMISVKYVSCFKSSDWRNSSLAEFLLLIDSQAVINV